LKRKKDNKFIKKEILIMNNFITDAKKELDYYKDTNTTSFGIQATEKLWGVLAHIIRLNQYLLGYNLPRTHGNNILYMKNLVTERELQELRKRANIMHKRFYTANFNYDSLIADYNYVLRKKNEYINKIKMR